MPKRSTNKRKSTSGNDAKKQKKIILSDEISNSFDEINERGTNDFYDEFLTSDSGMGFFN